MENVNELSQKPNGEIILFPPKKAMLFLFFLQDIVGSIVLKFKSQSFLDL